MENTKCLLLATITIFNEISTLAANERFLYFIMHPLGHKRIAIIENEDECDWIVNVLKSHCQTMKVLGFDCEWVTVGRIRRPIALLQLSSSKGLCALFRLCRMRQIPKSLRDLLRDDEVLKVGVDPIGDAEKLCDDYGVSVASTYDLRFLAAYTGRKPEGLARMSQSVLGVVLDKSLYLTCSNWEAEELADYQIHYAANDALVAVEIFKKLSSQLRPKNCRQLSESHFVPPLVPIYDKIEDRGYGKHFFILLLFLFLFIIFFFSAKRD